MSAAPATSTLRRAASRTAAVARLAPAPSRSPAPALRLVAAPKRRRGFGLYVSLCLALLVGSAGAVLWLNTALAQGSFEIHELETKLEHLEVQRDVINEQLVARAEPDALAAKAAELGMVESPATGYILVREGTVIGAAPAAGSEAETEAETEASEPSQETAVPTGEETIDTASDGDE